MKVGAVTALKMPSKKYFARGKLKFQAQIPEKVGGGTPPFVTGF